MVNAAAYQMSLDSVATSVGLAITGILVARDVFHVIATFKAPSIKHVTLQDIAAAYLVVEQEACDVTSACLGITISIQEGRL